MPSQTTTVGPLTLPVAAGAPGEAITDPTVEALLDWLAFWLKNSLDAKLATFTNTSADAVPLANRFAFDPTHPRGHHVRLPVPSLFVWWSGPSTVWQQTMVYTWRSREISALYVVEELPQFLDTQRRRGLLAAADAAFHKASERQQHPLYGYNGAAPGTPLAQSLGGDATFGWELVRSTPGRFGIGDQRGTNVTAAADKSGRDFPALRATFNVHERVDGDTFEDPADVLGDSLFDIRGTDEGGPGVEIMHRWLTSPDGSEQEGE